MSLASDVAAAVGSGGKLLIDLNTYAAEADANGVISVGDDIATDKMWNLNNLQAVEVLGHGWYTLKFRPGDNPAYGISLVGVQHVHFDGWKMHMPTNSTVAILGARKFIDGTSSGTSLNDWYMERFRLSVNATKAGVFLHGVEIDNWIGCDLTNTYSPTGEVNRGYAVYYADNNALGVAGAGSVWQNAGAVSTVQHRFAGGSFAQYGTGTAALPTACIGLQSNIRNLILDNCGTAPTGGALLRIIDTGNSDVSIRDCNLEGSAKEYAVLVDAAVDRLMLRGGLVQASLAGVYCGASSTGEFMPNALSAPKEMVLADRTTWNGSKYFRKTTPLFGE